MTPASFTFVIVNGQGDGSATMNLPSNRCWLEALSFDNCSNSGAVQAD